MSGVDVLAVLDRRLQVMESVYGGCGWEAKELRQAREAVAELIEADRAYDIAREAYDHGSESFLHYKSACDRRKSALSNCVTIIGERKE